jgi:hypothetical protein
LSPLGVVWRRSEIGEIVGVPDYLAVDRNLEG